MTMLDRARRVLRIDKFVNLLTGLGTRRAYDEQIRWQQREGLDRETLDSIWSEHELAWKIVELLPNDALRGWIEINHPRASEINAVLKRINAKPLLLEGLKAARAHGGCGMYVELPDYSRTAEGSPAMPVIYSQVSEIQGLELVERWYLTPERLSRRLAHTHYQIYDTNRVYTRIHRSRLIILPGAPSSRDWRASFASGWWQSYITRCFWPLMAYSVAHNMIPQILKDFVRDVIKIMGLTELAANDCDESRQSLQDRMDYMFQAQSTINKIVLDKEDEFIRQTASIAGINDLIRNPEKWLVAASGIPHTKLLGESPGAALSQAGSSQDRDWSQAVMSYQEDVVRPALDQLLLFVAAELGITDEIEYSFRPLDNPGLDEHSKSFKTMADALAVLVREQVISPEEAATVFAGERLRLLPVLDEGREYLSELNGDDIDDDSDEDADAQGA